MATEMTGGTSKLVLSQKTDSGNTVNLYVYYKIDSQSITNNKTTLKLGMYVTVSGGGSIGPWSNNENSYLGTTSITFSSAIPSVSSGSIYWIASEKAMAVEHESDGTGSATIKWKWGVYSTWGNVIRPSGSFTITLPTIARESTFTISPSNGNKIGNKPTFNIEAKNSSFTHTLQYKYGNQTSYTTIVSKTSSKAYSSWAIPVGAYEFLDENADQLKRKTPISIKCITYNGSTKIGEVVKTLNAYSKGGSGFSVGECYIGGKTTISISKTDSSFTHILSYKYADSTEYFKITEKTSSGTISWDVPSDEFYKKIPNSKKLDIVLNCDSYYKDVFVASKSLNVAVLCKEALCKPVFGEVFITDTEGRATELTKNSNKFIKGYNKLNFSFSPVAQNNAAGITKVILSCGSLSNVLSAEEGKVLSTNGTSLSLDLEHVTEKIVKCTIFDSRGYDNTYTKDIDLIDYFKPEVVISASAVPDHENADKKQEYDEEGTPYDPTPVKLTLSLVGKIFNENFGTSDILNTATENFYIKYRFDTSSEFSDMTWNEMAVSFDGNNCKNSTEIFACFPEQENYYLQVLIQDAVYNNNNNNNDNSSFVPILIEKVINYIPVFDWGNNDFQFNVPVVLKKGGFYNYENENKTEARQSASLDMNNGDLVGCNAIIFNDTTSDNEGLFFPNGSYWDVLRIYQGRLQIIPKFGSKDVSDPFDEKQYSIYNLFYKPGDKITYPDNLFPSFCGFFSSTGTKTLFITIPFSKPCFGCSSAQLSGTLRIRTVSGSMKTINMASLPTEIDSVTTRYHEDMGLILEIVFKEAKNSLLDFSTLQHTPISCSFSSEFTITLV